MKTARDQPQLVFTGILCVLQRDYGADSCLCYIGAVDCCHSGPCPTSLTALWLSDRLLVLENLPLDDPTPAHILLHHPYWELPGQLSPSFTIHTVAHWLTHPLVPLVTDGVGLTVKQGQESGLTLITLALLPAITFSFPSSVPSNPSVASIKSRAIYSSPPGMFYYNT